MHAALHSLESRLGTQWSAIAAARQKTEEVVATLSATLADLEDSTFSIIVTGSLGRGEMTEGSDADWVLLVDGPSNPDHASVLPEIERRVRRIVPKEVGRSGTFGEIVTSHDLVHYIAGTQDSNRNLTRRILLLSESRALTNRIVRERVIRNVLSRYVFHDRPVRSRTGRRGTVPYFLLNDVVRYWRTVASDYASKMWERQREGWGIRNIKLRFSRRLLYMWGLIAALTVELFDPEELRAARDDDEYYMLLAEAVRRQTEITPLELVARVTLEANDDDVARAIFSSYDRFLAVLADEESRRKLEEVGFDEALDEPTYAGLRQASQSFRDGVVRLFFDAHPKLPRLMREFGVF